MVPFGLPFPSADYPVQQWQLDEDNNLDPESEYNKGRDICPKCFLPSDDNTCPCCGRNGKRSTRSQTRKEIFNSPHYLPTRLAASEDSRLENANTTGVIATNETSTKEELDVSTAEESSAADLHVAGAPKALLVTEHSQRGGGGAGPSKVSGFKGENSAVRSLRRTLRGGKPPTERTLRGGQAAYGRLVASLR